MTHTATSSIEIAASPERVWQALTSPDAIRQYMFGAEFDGEWKAGSTVRFRGVWDGKAFEDKGTVLELDPPRSLRLDFWSAMSGQPDTPENRLPISYRLEPTDTGTRLTVTQGNNPTTEAAEQAEGNWKLTLDTLKSILA